MRQCKQIIYPRAFMLTERSQQRQDGATGERADDGRTNKPVPRKGSVEGSEPSDDKCPLRATDGKRKIIKRKMGKAHSGELRSNDSVSDGLFKPTES